MQIDVRPDHLEIIKNALKLHVPDRKVVAFGSRVKWTARDTSDLDLCVMGDDKISFETLAALRNELSDSNLPYKVDVIDWASIAPDFRQIIDQRNEEIQKPIKELKFISVGQFSPFIYGKSLPETTRNAQGSVPVYGSSGFVGRHDKALTNGPTVIIGRKGTIGKVTYSIAPCWPIDTTFFVEGSAERNIRYTYYALKSLGLEQMNSDSAVPGLNRDNAHARVLPKRSVQEQTKIADILSALDDKIELNNKMNETLEATVQALFKSWFVDFEPVKAKLEGRKPEGLTADLAALFPDKLVDSPLGQIPHGWDFEPLGNYVTIKRGGSPRPIHDYLATEGLPWVKISDATACSSPFLLATNQFIKKEGLNKTVFLKRGELILSNSATPGLPKFLNLDACIHDGWLYFPAKKLFNDNYLYQLFLVLKEEFISKGNGSVFTNLKTDIIKTQNVVVPPKELIKAYGEVASSLFKRVLAGVEENQKIASTRDTLLPKLISGELRVGDAASKIKEAV